MAYSFSLSDVDYLVSDAGISALAALAERPLTPATAITDAGAARAIAGSHGPAVLETAALRRRASGKVPGGERWLWTSDALAQATAAVISAHRARRFAGREIWDLTCSVGTELAALGGGGTGTDLDPVRIAMAHYNLGAATRPQPLGATRPQPLEATRLSVADALTADLDSAAPGTVFLADPGRRSAGGGRRFDPRDTQPPLPDLLARLAGRNFAVKCAPGLDYSELLVGARNPRAVAGEVSVTSVDGGVKEACLYSPSLALPGVTRSAVVIRRGQVWEGITDADPDEIATKAPGRFLVDPDGAIVRAHLVRGWAHRHGLWQLDPRIAYLTGDAVPEGVRGFEVLEQLPFREKTLRAALAGHDAGALEILARGVPIDPDVLRKKLRPSGSSPISVVITRLGRHPMAFICRVRLR